MLLNVESESRIPNPENPNPQCKNSAIKSGILIRRFFGRIAIPGNKKYLQVLTNIFYLSRRGCVIPPLPLKNTGWWGGVAWRRLVPEFIVSITFIIIYIFNTLYKLYLLSFNENWIKKCKRIFEYNALTYKSIKSQEIDVLF